MKYLALFSLILTFNTLDAQFANKKKIELQLNSGLGIYVQNNSFNTNRTIGGVPKLFDINASYFIEDRLSIGVNLRYHNFIIDDTDTTTRVDQGDGGAIHFTTNFYWLNNKKFNLYSGIAFGAVFINVHATDLNSLETGYAELAGNSYYVNTGFNWYFWKGLGLNLKLAYINQNYEYKYLELNGNETQEIDGVWVIGNHVNHRGLFSTLGLSYSF